MGLLTEDKVTPLVSSDPPLAVQNLIRRISDEQEVALEAIWNNDDNALFSAFLMDPLVNIPVDKAHELFKRMIDEGSLRY